MDLNWDRYIKYRILPEFFSTDLHILFNQKKWNALSPKTREILQRVAIEHEVSSLQDAAGAVAEGAGRARQARHQDAVAVARGRRRSSSPARAPRAFSA